jgi:hypothetical protein
MIVRILHEGQYRISGADIDKLNEIDDQLVSSVAAGDQTKFQGLWKQLVDTVKSHGKPVAVDEFVESDVILPAVDSTMEEVEHLFTGDGLIPG